MKALSLAVFVSAAVWSCTLFLYQWHHAELTVMETLKATPEALGEGGVLALLVVIVGAAMAWRLMERKPKSVNRASLKYVEETERGHTPGVLTWRCHVCGETRPDAMISVHTSTKVVMGGVSMKQNVRYCNDRPACVEAAKAHDFFKGKE